MNHEPMQPTTQKKYPATKTVHWPSGPVYACDEHARQLVGLSNLLGSHVGVTAAADGAECANCANEAKAHNASGKPTTEAAKPL